MFAEALEKYGRDWKKCAAHIKTRDDRSVASHAQKYFIKLYIKKLPLPDKVKESGDGYTLSGKPLNPDSAAARAYGVKGNEASKEYRKERLQKREKKEMDITSAASTGITSDSNRKYKRQRKKRNSTLSSDSSSSDTESEDVDESISDNESIKSNKPKPKQQSLQSLQQSQQQQQQQRNNNNNNNPDDGEDDEETLPDVPKREYHFRKAKQNVLLRDDTDLTTCHLYSGEPGSGKPNSQPFIVKVNTTSLLVVDFHCHCSNREVIGYLGGNWNAESRTITIIKAFPGRSLSYSGESDKHCEMDPIYEVQIKEEVTKEGMIIVGWYHSHPLFGPTPSMCDVTNQANYQIFFRDNKNNIDPFVGLIVSTFDSELQTEESLMNWFVTEGIMSNPMAMILQVEQNRDVINQEEILNICVYI